MDREELLELKEKVEKAKLEKSKLEGQLEAVMKDLKNNWGCATLEQARKKLGGIETEISELEEEIEKESNKLTTDYAIGSDQIST